MPSFAQYTLFWGEFGANEYMSYDYVHLDNWSDISVYLKTANLCVIMWIKIGCKSVTNARYETMLT